MAARRNAPMVKFSFETSIGPYTSLSLRTSVPDEPFYAEKVKLFEHRYYGYTADTQCMRSRVPTVFHTGHRAIFYDFPRHGDCTGVPFITSECENWLDGSFPSTDTLAKAPPIDVPQYGETTPSVRAYQEISAGCMAMDPVNPRFFVEPHTIDPDAPNWIDTSVQQPQTPPQALRNTAAPPQERYHAISKAKRTARALF